MGPEQLGSLVSAGTVPFLCLLQGGRLVVEMSAELSTAQDVKFFILQVPGPLVVAGREGEQPGPLTGQAG